MRQKVTIVGLGLIGGSIGLGLKQWSNRNGKRDDVLDITGFDIDLDNQNYAKKIKAVDRTEWNIVSAVESADLVILAVPALATREVMENIGSRLRDGTVVCDVSSTKADVMKWAEELLPPTVHFIGTHPMAGGSRSIESADGDLFRGATWCVVPSVQADEAAVQTVLGLVSALGAEPLFVDAHEHDGFVGAISHLPFVLSIALMRAVSSDPAWRDMQQLSATGFQDVSRLAGASAEMHRDICVTNREAVTRWIDEAVDELQQIRSLVSAGTEEADESLLQVFEEARDARARWATRERGDGSLVQGTDDELVDFSVGGQFSQLVFGSFLRRKPRFGSSDSKNGKNSRR
ncbi:prephenate dehydrogenase/arogenate dehydrogenase family protein [soil metagenome]